MECASPRLIRSSCGQQPTSQNAPPASALPTVGAHRRKGAIQAALAGGREFHRHHHRPAILGPGAEPLQQPQASSRMGAQMPTWS